jgi:formylmethanofuran dehydrogenase subunit B
MEQPKAMECGSRKASTDVLKQYICMYVCIYIYINIYNIEAEEISRYSDYNLGCITEESRFDSRQITLDFYFLHGRFFQWAPGGGGVKRGLLR